MTQMLKSIRTPNSSRPQGARNKFFRAEKQRRREEAEARAEVRKNMSPQQQLARLDRLLGAGVGAARERARLHAQIAARTAGGPVTSQASGPDAAAAKKTKK